MRFHGLLIALLLSAGIAHAQAPSGPPSVGVVRAQQTAITETSEFVGRVQAVERVALTARVTAFLDQRLFNEGSEVKQGDVLYRLERGPFEAALRQQEATVADASARLANANIQLARAQSLLATPAGQRSNVDDAVANRGARDQENRALAIGLRPADLRITAFAMSGSAAGLSGGLSAFNSGSVFPAYAAIGKSVDGLLMVLLGGIDTVTGPVVGAIVYTGLYDLLLQTIPRWRLVLGLAIVGLVLVFPDGIAGGRRRA